MSTPDKTDYAYILRLWRERPATAGQGAVWRISLTDTRSGERRAFSGLEALLAFLCARVLDEPMEADKAQATCNAPEEEG